MAGRVVLRAYEGQFVRVTNSNGDIHIPPCDAPDTWEIFRRTELGDNKVQLEPANSTATNRLYLSAEGGGGDLILARRAPAGDWETFTLVVAGPQVSLRAHNGDYLCAEGRGGDLVLANRAVAGEWERFDLVDLGGGRIALRTANGAYLRAEAGGGGRVVVNRDNRDQEVVRLEVNGGYLSLKAANGRYWSARGGGYGGAPVLANRTEIGGDWEKFGLTNNADGTIALRAKEGRKYVQAEDGGGARVLANGDAIGIWEKFTRTPWYDRPRPRKLLSYHGDPSMINGAGGDPVRAGREFSRYEYVILAQALESTREIIANIQWNTAGVTKVFGRLPPSAEAAGWWKDLGVDGIFLDEFGSGRGKQNDAVNRIHDLGLTVIASPEDPAALTATDFYYLDGFAIRGGDYADWHTRAEQVRAYQSQHDFRVLSSTTPGTTPFDQAKFDYAWYAAMLYGHEAFGWTEHGDPDAAPYRRRPSLTPGYFTTPVTESGTAYERRTDLGTIFVDPTTRQAGTRES